jgi:hypothetical protein
VTGSAEIALGAEVGGKGIALEAAIGGLRHQVSKLDTRMAELSDAIRHRMAFAAEDGVTQVGAGNNTTVALPMVPVGRVWSILTISIAPIPVTTQVTCNVWLFIGSPAGGAVGSQYYDSFVGGAIPVTWGPKGPGDAPIRGGDQLYLVFGPTASATPVQVNARFHDMRDMDIPT